MTDVDEWQENNARYLTAALTWLRLRLERRAQAVGADPSVHPVSLIVPAGVEVTPASARRRFWGPRPAAPAAPRPQLPPPAAVPFDEQIAKAAAEMQAAADEADQPPALILLSRRLGLSPFEQETLLLCAAVELDTRIAALCARAQGTASSAYPTFALAL